MPARSATLSANPKPADEKLTINIGCVDLGQIDLLVQEGFYAIARTSSAPRSATSWPRTRTPCAKWSSARRWC
jgi:hypothetical protein